jgi:hypothetical protein
MWMEIVEDRVPSWAFVLAVVDLRNLLFCYVLVSQCLLWLIYLFRTGYADVHRLISVSYPRQTKANSWKENLPFKFLLHSGKFMAPSVIHPLCGSTCEVLWTKWHHSRFFVECQRFYVANNIPPLPHTHLSSTPEVCGSPDQAAHYQILGL